MPKFIVCLGALVYHHCTGRHDRYSYSTCIESTCLNALLALVYSMAIFTFKKKNNTKRMAMLNPPVQFVPFLDYLSKLQISLKKYKLICTGSLLVLVKVTYLPELIQRHSVRTYSSSAGMYVYTGNARFTSTSRLLVLVLCPYRYR